MMEQKKIVERTEIEMETSNTFKIYEHPGLFALDFIGGKKSISTPHFGGGLHNLSIYKTALNFSKPIKLSPKAVSKSHRKSQKNHKMKNLIVLDSK